MIPHSTGLTQAARTHGVCDLQSTNELLRNYSRGTDFEQILKVRLRHYCTQTDEELWLCMVALVQR